MTPLVDVLLAIGVATIAVFFASFVAWTLLPHHKPDLKRLPDESAFFSAVKPLGLPPGNYLFPQPASPAEYKSEEFQNAYRAGPWGVLTLGKSQPVFPRNLALVFMSYLAVCFLAGYLTSLAVPPDASFGSVFRVSFTACSLGFVFGGLPNDIFFMRPRRFVVTCLIDAIVFAAIGGAMLALLWP